MENINYENLDPGIRETVRWLRSQGFNTVDSGDGVTKYSSDSMYDPSEILNIPHVACLVLPQNLIAEADRLATELINIDIIPSAFMEGVPCIQASYDPVDKTAILELFNINDKMIHHKVQKIVH